MAASQYAGPSLEDILSRHGLEKKDLERRCPQGVRITIATKLEDWKTTGHYFGVPTEKLAAIDREHATEDQRRIALLDCWDKREGRSASCLKLADVLHRRERADLVELLCTEMMKLSLALGKSESASSDKKQLQSCAAAKTTKKEKQGAQSQGGRARSGSTPACPSPANKKKESGASGSKSAQSSPSSLKKEQAATAVGKKGASHSKLQGSTSVPLAKGSPAVSPLVKQSSATSGHSELQMPTIPTELFATPPLDEAICKKCKNVAREPMHPSCCEKQAKCMLCKPCSEKSKCPHHKKTPERWILDQTLKTRISKWTIKCPNEQCGEKFAVSKLDKHLAESQRCAKALSQPATKGPSKSVPKRESH